MDFSPGDIKKIAQALQAYGRNGDKIVAHINPEEAKLLKMLGGAGTRNPDTGLLEFFSEGDGPNGEGQSGEPGMGGSDGNTDSSDQDGVSMGGSLDDGGEDAPGAESSMSDFGGHDPNNPSDVTDADVTGAIAEMAGASKGVATALAQYGVPPSMVVGLSKKDLEGLLDKTREARHSHKPTKEQRDLNRALHKGFASANPGVVAGIHGLATVASAVVPGIGAVVGIGNLANKASNQTTVGFGISGIPEDLPSLMDLGIDVDLPDFDLPDIPDFDLPDLPDISLPDISLPDVDISGVVDSLSGVGDPATGDSAPSDGANEGDLGQDGDEGSGDNQQNSDSADKSNVSESTDPSDYIETMLNNLFNNEKRWQPMRSADIVRRGGRFGDTELAALSAEDVMQLLRAGGSGDINPNTGLPEFAQQGNFDAAWYLEQNPDVAAAGVDAWDHYNTMGRNEGRLGNTQEKAARDEGFTDPFGEGRYTTWKQNKDAEAAAAAQREAELNAELDTFRGSDGQIRSDLLGGKYTSSDDFSIDNLDVLRERQKARDNKFMGEFGGGNYNRYYNAYFDHDNNPETPWVTTNTSNIDRYGRDASAERDPLRELGFDDVWGEGSAGDFWRNWLSENPTFSGNGPADAVGWSPEPQAPQEEPWQAAIASLTTQLTDLISSMTGSRSTPLTPTLDMPTTSPLYNPYAYGSDTRSLRPVVNRITGNIEYVPVDDRMVNSYAPDWRSSRRAGWGDLIRV